MSEIILKNFIKNANKEYFISTMSMKIRHTFFEKDKDLIVYETMVFLISNEEIDYSKPIYNERWKTEEEAIAQHGHIVKNFYKFFKQELSSDFY